MFSELHSFQNIKTSKNEVSLENRTKKTVQFGIALIPK